MCYSAAQRELVECEFMTLPAVSIDGLLEEEEEGARKQIGCQKEVIKMGVEKEFEVWANEEVDWKSPFSFQSSVFISIRFLFLFLLPVQFSVQFNFATILFSDLLSS